MSRADIFDLFYNFELDKNPTCEIIATEEFDGYKLEHIRLHINDNYETIPGYFAKPHDAEGKLPCVIVNHSHGGNYQHGKKEATLSSDYLQKPSYFKELTELGFSACCIDMLGFNERGGMNESELVKMLLLQGKSLWQVMVTDSLNLVNYLSMRSDVDHNRIATIGMSMGALHSWWLAALDERIKVVIDIAGQVEWETMIAERQLDRHGLYAYVPGLLRVSSTAELQSLIAPRARMSLVGINDALCPLRGAQKLENALNSTYSFHQSLEKWQMIYDSCGHMETKYMREMWKSFLKEQL